MRIKLAPPWVEYCNKLIALFQEDRDIKIINNVNTNREIKFLITGQKKYEALSKLLPEEKIFGNVSIRITLVPANESLQTSSDDLEQVYRDAFSGNPIVTKIVPVNGVFTNKFTYVAFRKEVVQFFNDNLHDLHGNLNTLYQNIADEIFEDHKNGINFCTDLDTNKLGDAPLGEWP